MSTANEMRISTPKTPNPKPQPPRLFQGPFLITLLECYILSKIWCSCHDKEGPHALLEKNIYSFIHYLGLFGPLVVISHFLA